MIDPVAFQARLREILLESFHPNVSFPRPLELERQLFQMSCSRERSAPIVWWRRGKRGTVNLEQPVDCRFESGSRPDARAHFASRLGFVQGDLLCIPARIVRML